MVVKVVVSAIIVLSISMVIIQKHIGCGYSFHDVMYVIVVISIPIVIQQVLIGVKWR